MVERHGNLTTIERTFSTYPWLERMRGHAYPGMIDLLDSSGVLWAPLQVLVSAPTTCTVPKSVYLFFHTDSIENKAVGRGCCGELSPGYTGVAERPYCTERGEKERKVKERNERKERKKGERKERAKGRKKERRLVAS